MQRPNFAVRAISEGLRKESDRIRCTCVYPGVVESELANTISDRIALERMHSYRKMAIQPDAMKNPKCPPYGSYSKIRRLPALYGQVTVPDGGERGRAVSVISHGGKRRRHGLQLASRPDWRYHRSVPVVQHPWDPQLVSVRREICPNARWNKARRVWAMTDEEADMFLKAAHRCMVLGRSSCMVGIDNVDWVIGFVEGAPFRRKDGIDASPHRQ
jgi:hypothetical protein